MEREGNTITIKNNKLAGVILAIIGVVLIGGGFLVMNSANSAKQKMTESVSATLETDGMYTDADGQWMYEPTYIYRVGDREYRCKTNASSFEPMTMTDVYYDPANPGDCMSREDRNSAPFVHFILFGLGGVLIVGGVITMFMKQKSE